MRNINNRLPNNKSSYIPVIDVFINLRATDAISAQLAGFSP